MAEQVIIEFVGDTSKLEDARNKLDYVPGKKTPTIILRYIDR
jgi:hypothetical protein